MEKAVLKLYVNDPMGGRWKQNVEAASLAEKTLGAKLVIIKKTSSEYASEKNPPPCPSVTVNAALIVENGTVTFDQLKEAISKQGKG